jgi:D-alanine transaminase
MARTVYVNGEFVSEEKAKISIFDRGFLFSDSVYEVTAVLTGKLVSWDGHIDRLQRSLTRLNISVPFDGDTLLSIHRQLIKLNDLSDGLIYMQVSRGLAERDFFIKQNLKPSLVMFSQKINLLDSSRLNRCLKVITVPETRWRHRDIKTTQLLAASLAKTDAQGKGFDDAWFVEDGYVTEGTTSNAFIVIDNKKIITRKISKNILPGVTRFSIVEIAKFLGLEVEERPFSVKEAELAKEAFITSATIFIASVVEINGNVIGNGAVGNITKSLREQYLIDIKKSR